MERWARFPVDAELPLSKAVRERRPVVMESLADRDRRFPTEGEAMPDDHAVACLPMLVQDHVVGGMSISFPEPRTFDADAIAFLEAVTTQTGQAMRRAALYEGAFRPRRGGARQRPAPAHRGCERRRGRAARVRRESVPACRAPGATGRRRLHHRRGGRGRRRRASGRRSSGPDETAARG